MEKNLKRLIEVSKAEGKNLVVMQIIEKIMNKRISIVGNSMRQMLGISENDIDKDSIVNCIKELNEISSDLGVDFYIEEDWNHIEYFLRSTVLEDIFKEFQKQAN